MRILVIAVLWLCVAARCAFGAENVAPNPAIDMARYLEIANEAAAHRESHRLGEADFARMAREPGTVVLDARSAQKYDELHVGGAIT